LEKVTLRRLIFASTFFRNSAMQESQEQQGRPAVLALLKREGPISADGLAARLGVTAMAVRQHLYALESGGLVAHSEEKRKRGRPVKLWRTTEKANARFADSHSALAADLIGQMRKAFGERGVDRLLKLRTAEQEKLYAAKLANKHSLAARVAALAKQRDREGYMAEVRRDEVTGGLLLVENHCPVCAAARICTGLCREELALFRRVLGSNVEVERVTHILAGAGRCAYRITQAG
jgi:predicted ArsR family transcriptional regulator